MLNLIGDNIYLLTYGEMLRDRFNTRDKRLGGKLTSSWLDRYFYLFRVENQIHFPI